MLFNKVNLKKKYIKYSECKPGDVLVVGKYVETIPSVKYPANSNHDFKTETGEIVSLNCFYNGNLRKFNPKNVIYKCPEKLFCDFFTVMSSKNIADKFFNIYDDLKTTKNHHLEDFFYKRILEYGFSHRKINSDILTFLR